ncbi:MAG TPA: tetratricopeptide repeat protein, partial [Bacteroidetes bacterium]|nr:tetratricopeptide repeat protein [Bacteroidota bacterium]
EEAAESGQSFLEKNKTLLIGGGVVVLAIILFFVIQSRGADTENLEAQVDMINPTIYYEQDSFDLSINGNGQFVGFNSLSDDYSGTKSGNLMKYYVGTAYLKIGNYDQAILYLEEFNKGDNMVSAASLAALAAAHEQKSDFSRAGELYEDAARTPEENDFTTPYYLMHAGRNYESAGENDKALALYEKIRNQYPLSEQAADGSIDKYIAKLSPEDIDG